MNNSINNGYLIINRNSTKNKKIEEIKLNLDKISTINKAYFPKFNQNNN